ncbi:hypothetical protein PQX77_019582 [Marasmius sp. AFHP31]|nr:hypothetical protein PQX77_019582 [Marasmius sp. AFHP31]
MSSSDVNVMLANALRNFDIPIALQPFIPAFIDIMLTLRKLGPHSQNKESLPELCTVLQKYKHILLQLSSIRVKYGGMEDAFPGSFLLTIFEQTHSQLQASNRFKKVVNGWWPADDSVRAKFRREGCEPFDMTLLPEAALELHFQSPQVPTSSNDLYASEVIDDIAEEEDENAAPQGQSTSEGASEHQSSNSEATEDEESDNEASQTRPPHQPSAAQPLTSSSEYDSDYNIDVEPPDTEEINRWVLATSTASRRPFSKARAYVASPRPSSPSEASSPAAAEVAQHLQKAASEGDSMVVDEEDGYPRPTHPPRRESSERCELLHDLGELARKKKQLPVPQASTSSAAAVTTRIGCTVVTPKRLQGATVPSTSSPSKRKFVASGEGSDSDEEVNSQASSPAPSQPAKTPKTSSKGKRRAKVHKHSGTRAGAKHAKRPKYSSPPPGINYPGEVGGRDRASVVGSVNNDPEPLWKSLPGTNHADDNVPVFWDEDENYFLVKNLAGVPSGALRDLRGHISTLGGMDLHINHFVNATAPMRCPGPSQANLVCFNCVEHPETCIPIPAVDIDHLPNSRNSEEFDKMKELCALWGESSKIGLQRQLSEIAEGRRTVESLIKARDQLDSEISRLARLDIERVAKFREACREPRDILRHLSREDSEFFLTMPTIIQMCSVFGWEFSELPKPLTFGRDQSGVPYLRNDTTGEVMLIPSTSDFPTGTPAA